MRYARSETGGFACPDSPFLTRCGGCKYSPRVSGSGATPMDRDENPSPHRRELAYNFYDGGKRAADLNRTGRVSRRARPRECASCRVRPCPT